MNSKGMTERARQVMRRAKEEAQRMGCSHASTEHILLGLIHETDSVAVTSVAVTALRNLGVDLSLLRKKTQSQIQNTSNYVEKDSTQLSPSGKQALQFAHQEAEALGVNFIGTEHLLLGVIRETEGAGARVLLSQGVDLAKARAELLRLMGVGSRDSDARAQASKMESNRASRTFGVPAAKFVVCWNSGTECEAIMRRAVWTAFGWGGPPVSTEHLLLGLLDEPGTRALAVLLSLGVNLERIREQTLMSMQKVERSGEGEQNQVSLACMDAINLGYGAARFQGKEFMEAEHLLLGLFLVNEGETARLLLEEGVTLAKLRAEITRLKERDDPPAACP